MDRPRTGCGRFGTETVFFTNVGWSDVCCLFDISLIIEYVGEVLTDEQSVQRLIDAQKQGARHVYMMQLDNCKTTVAMHCVLLFPLLWLWLWLFCK
jgi:hypothetical protein